MKMTGTRSLLRRIWIGFALTLLGAWAVLLGYEFYTVKVVLMRGAMAENNVCARASLDLAELLRDRPEQLPEMLNKREHQFLKMWKELGFAPPATHLQVLVDGALVHESTYPPRASGPLHSADGEPLLEPERRWIDTRQSSADGKLVVRRWLEMPGGWHFSTAGLRYYTRPLLFALPLLLLPVWWILRQGLKPLRRIGANIEQRAETDLRPLPPTPYAELTPVVQAVNRLMGRLDQRLQREREFVDDAAHELKTPLAVVQVNAEQLLTTQDASRRQAAAAGLRDGVERMTHTVHQMLSLTRSGGEVGAPGQAPHDLVELAQDRLGLMVGLAARRNIELAFEAPEQALLPMSRDCLGSLIDNLVDNAIKYTPEGGQVLVRIAKQADQLEFSVADSGPGIPTVLHAKVFERFFRLPGQNQAGSGLGLAIVERTAARHGARVNLGQGLNGGGLTVSVRFALA